MVKRKPQKKVEEKPKIEPAKTNASAEIPKELFARAKKVGLSDEQINLKGANLKPFLDSISPTTNPDAKPKVGEIKPVPKPEAMPTVMDVNNDKISEERSIIQAVIRRLNIKFNTPKIKTIKKTVVYDCEKKQVVSAKYEILKG